jgi:F0F1-type ATP synthase alpha subunit
VSCARANAPLNTATAAQAKAWGKTLLNKDRFVMVFLLQLKSCSQLYPIGRGWREAVIGNNPAGVKKFRATADSLWKPAAVQHIEQPRGKKNG